MDKSYKVVFSDGSKGYEGGEPIAVVYQEVSANADGSDERTVTYDLRPVLNHAPYNNLYGRVMTLIEATTDPSRLEAVKNVFSKELLAWFNDVKNDSNDITNGIQGSNNIYTRGR